MLLTFSHSRNVLYVVFTARSISEEFSSDARYRDNGEPAQGAAHGRDPRSPKEKEDKERGDEGISTSQSSESTLLECFSLSHPFESDVFSYRDDQGVRWQQFLEAANISSDFGTQAGYDGASTHIGTARISHHERS